MKNQDLKRAVSPTHCVICLASTLKRNLSFDEVGVCSACRAFSRVAEVDFAERRSALAAILDRGKDRNPSNYDCIIPVSGGKDSVYQILRVKELGANPLCVVVVPDFLSDLGRRNLANLRSLGVDLIEVHPSRHVSRALSRTALRRIGSPLWPETVAIYTVPVRFAVQMRIPVVVWGENPQFEDGWPAEPGSGVLSAPWNGVLQGLALDEAAAHSGLCEHELIQYVAPTNEELRILGFRGVFLGYYIPWDPFGNAVVAGAHGFESSGAQVGGALSSSDGLDNLLGGIENYLIYLKTGASKATAVASALVRRGILRRRDALELAQRAEGRYPREHLGVPLACLLDALAVSPSEFVGICDRLTNRDIFRSDPEGMIQKDENGVPLMRAQYQSLAVDADVNPRKAQK